MNQEMGVKAGCKPRGDVLQGELDDAIFAASFDKLTRGEGPLIYRDPALFFQNTHPTVALSKLCRDVFGRMASSTDSGAVLRLSTGFGGGKHTVLVITDPKEQPADATNAARLEHPAHVIEQQTGRQATVIEPIGKETAQVIIRRLFDQVDHAAAAKASVWPLSSIGAGVAVSNLNTSGYHAIKIR